MHWSASSDKDSNGGRYFRMNLVIHSLESEIPYGGNGNSHLGDQYEALGRFDALKEQQRKVFNEKLSSLEFYFSEVRGYS